MGGIELTSGGGEEGRQGSGKPLQQPSSSGDGLRYGNLLEKHGQYDRKQVV